MLCLGGSRVLAELYDEHFGPDGQVVEVVVDEVRGWASVYVAAGDPRRLGGVKRAGSAAVSRYAGTLLAAPIPTPAPVPTGIAVILQELEDYANRKRLIRTARAGNHVGETFSIHEAAARGMRFVSNDDGARHVAGVHAVTHESFADIARRLSKCQRDVKPKQIVKELQMLLRNGIDTGDVVNFLDLG